MGFGPGYFSRPNASYGYYRGAPQYGGQGSGMGPKKNGVSASSMGVTTSTGTGAWHPTIKYMFILIAAEVVVFGWIGKLAGI